MKTQINHTGHSDDKIRMAAFIKAESALLRIVREQMKERLQFARGLDLLRMENFNQEFEWQLAQNQQAYDDLRRRFPEMY